MKKVKVIMTLTSLLVFIATTTFAVDDLMKRAQGMFKPIPATVSDIKGKTFTAAKIELGKMLYFDPRLSSSALISWIVFNYLIRRTNAK